MAHNPVLRPFRYPQGHPVSGRSPARRYAVSVIVVALGWAAREMLSPTIGPTALPFVFFFPAVAAAAWYAGLSGGIVAAALSALSADLFFMEPVGSLGITRFADVAGLGAFLLASAFIVAAMEGMHRHKARAEAAAVEQARVENELRRIRGVFPSGAGRARQAGGAGGDDATSPDVRPVPPIPEAGEMGPPPAERRIGLLFIVAAGLLVGTTILVYQMGLIRIRAQEAMAAQLHVLNQIESLVSALTDTETRQRGYLLTRDESYLGTYAEAVTRARATLDGLHRLVITGHLPEAAVDEIANLTEEKLEMIDRRIHILQEEGIDAAVRSIRAGRDRMHMDRLRGRIGDLASAERREYAAADDRAAWAIDIRTTAFVLSTVINLLFLGWMYRRILSDTRLRDRASAELSRQKELLAATLASIGDAVIVTDHSGRVVFLNPQAEELTAWTSDECAGRDLTDVFRIIREQTREPAENPVERVLREGTVVTTASHTLLLARDGREIPIDDSAAPIRNSSGPIHGIVLVFRDITQRRAMESALSSARVEMERHAANLERTVAERTRKLRETVLELEAFSYTIAHDLRAPLRAMRGYASILMEEHGTLLSESASDYLRRIAGSAMRMDRLIHDVLNFSKVVRSSADVAPLDAQHLIEEIISSYPDLHAPGVSIEIEPPLPRVIANPAMLTQVYSNLLGNAVKFVAPGTAPHIRVIPEVFDGRVRIWFHDNGIGIEPGMEKRIFDPFHTLNPEDNYEGMGIGLAIVRKAMEKMGGAVGVTSGPQGSSFWIELEMASDAGGNA